MRPPRMPQRHDRTGRKPRPAVLSDQDHAHACWTRDREARLRDVVQARTLDAPPAEALAEILLHDDLPIRQRGLDGHDDPAPGRAHEHLAVGHDQVPRRAGTAVVRRAVVACALSRDARLPGAVCSRRGRPDRLKRSAGRALDPHPLPGIGRPPFELDRVTGRDGRGRQRPENDRLDVHLADHAGVDPAVVREQASAVELLRKRVAGRELVVERGVVGGDGVVALRHIRPDDALARQDVECVRAEGLELDGDVVTVGGCRGR